MAYRGRPGRIGFVIVGVVFLPVFLLNDVSIAPPASASHITKRSDTVKNAHIVAPAVSSETVLNPGQGWVLYGTPKNQTAKTLAYGSVGYMRYNWSDLEPTEGVYNWPLIDNDFNAWMAVGKKFAFGVMNANSSTPTKHYVTPQ